MAQMIESGSLLNAPFARPLVRIRTDGRTDGWMDGLKDGWFMVR